MRSKMKFHIKEKTKTKTKLFDTFFIYKMISINQPIDT